jgi:hypothetical protein
MSVLARLEADLESLKSSALALRFLELVLGYFQTVLVVELETRFYKSLLS